MENQKEIWKDIEGYEGYYQISNLGKIKSLERWVNNRFGTLSKRKERILKSKRNKSSRYAYIMLCINNNIKTCTLHRLLAQHFIPNPHNYPIINHKDHNSFNNSLDNLEWTTQSQNVRHAYEAGRCEKLKKKNSELLKIRHQNKDLTLKNYRNHATI